ncbi:MAG: SCO1664 family protein [Dehalococcoidia bacterium]|nr:SCO1664 family protein [Dehalococcoidia bacterium]
MTNTPLLNPWKPGAAWVESALAEAEFGELRLIQHSSNYVFLADLEHPEHGHGLGIYKPATGEQPLYDFPEDLYHREIAAYEFARLLGWDIIPPTVEATGPHGVGSLQLFIEHNPQQHYFDLRDRDELDWQFVRFALFDLVANNADRKGGHLLLQTDGDEPRIWGIDNGLCFHEVEKFRTVVWDFAGTTIPDGWLEDLRRVQGCLQAADPTAQPLLDRLTTAEGAALLQRIAHYLDEPVLPDMDTFTRRVVPWPMV